MKSNQIERMFIREDDRNNIIEDRQMGPANLPNLNYKFVLIVV